jgi:hypothetical protein
LTSVDSSSDKADPYGLSRSWSLSGQLDDERVGRELAVARQDLGGVVDLALQRRGDLDRLDGAAEGAREGARHRLLEPLLEPVKNSHATSLSCRPSRVPVRSSFEVSAACHVSSARQRRRSVGNTKTPAARADLPHRCSDGIGRRRTRPQGGG